MHTEGSETRVSAKVNIPPRDSTRRFTAGKPTPQYRTVPAWMKYRSGDFAKLPKLMLSRNASSDVKSTENDERPPQTNNGLFCSPAKHCFRVRYPKIETLPYRTRAVPPQVPQIFLSSSAGPFLVDFDRFDIFARLNRFNDAADHQNVLIRKGLTYSTRYTVLPMRFLETHRVDLQRETSKRTKGDVRVSRAITRPCAGGKRPHALRASFQFMAEA
jgi:hypothetical protein